MGVDFKTITYHEIWYSDLERAMKEIYNIDVKIAPMLDYPGQNTYYTYAVDGESEFDDIDDDAMYREWLETGEMDDLGPYPFFIGPVRHEQHGAIGIRHMFHRLFMDGHIPAGKYLMTVFW